MKEELFVNEILQLLEKRDKVHFDKISKQIFEIIESHNNVYSDIANLISQYFIKQSISPEKIVEDYLKMLVDFRNESLYFYREGAYSYKNQAIVNKNIYSNSDIMEYHMNGLLISQILWRQHFYTFLFFKNNVTKYFSRNSKLRMLEIGPGHGIFSYFTSMALPDFEIFDLVDISTTSLNMTQKILGEKDKRIKFNNLSVCDYNPDLKYNLIIMGEVLEHLDNPEKMLNKLSTLLVPNGVLWITTPTNAPAIDHVYLFNNKQEIIDLVNNSGLEVIESYGCYAEDYPEEKCEKRKVTQMVGLFCKIRN